MASSVAVSVDSHVFFAGILLEKRLVKGIRGKLETALLEIFKEKASRRSCQEPAARTLGRAVETVQKSMKHD
jgi:hypothetical protein